MVLIINRLVCIYFILFYLFLCHHIVCEFYVLVSYSNLNKEALINFYFYHFQNSYGFQNFSDKISITDVISYECYNIIMIIKSVIYVFYFDVSS